MSNLVLVKVAHKYRRLDTIPCGTFAHKYRRLDAENRRQRAHVRERESKRERERMKERE